VCICVSGLVSRFTAGGACGSGFIPQR
jgi:hypothetical protein